MRLSLLVEVRPYINQIILTSYLPALDRKKLLGSRTDRFAPVEEPPRYPIDRRLGETRAHLDTALRRKIYTPSVIESPPPNPHSENP
jgi:hypothetical protein